ncbi:HNH endonuclease [Nocardia sp. CY41]|uniref:HNH endonuclease n=1 Tax=Nocardia sp. CY41 TaxID=2608686 RepID=UPI001357B2E3
MTWSTDPDRYRGIPQTQADSIRRRDHHTCQKCGNPGHEVDHILNVKADGTDDDDNLQVLCKDCHDAKTQTEAAAGRIRHNRRRPTKPHPGLRATGATTPLPPPGVGRSA